jgi:hypothetical protein
MRPYPSPPKKLFSNFPENFMGREVWEYLETQKK